MTVSSKNNEVSLRLVIRELHVVITTSPVNGTLITTRDREVVITSSRAQWESAYLLQVTQSHHLLSLNRVQRSPTHVNPLHTYVKSTYKHRHVQTADRLRSTSLARGRVIVYILLSDDSSQSAATTAAISDRGAL